MTKDDMTMQILAAKKSAGMGWEQLADTRSSVTASCQRSISACISTRKRILPATG